VRALLDVNVLVALLDAAHVHHGAACAWLDAYISRGWASCPITQTGCARILSANRYPRAQPLAAVMQRLAEATSTPQHEFWPDEISVLDAQRFDAARWLTSRQVTDACLLALAVQHGGVFVTLDRRVDLQLVRGAKAQHLVVI
jgi:toxin-antitoxin system PIN domain toxin